MCQISLIISISLLFYEFNRVASFNEIETIFFSTIIISNSQIEILVSYRRSTNVNVNISFPNCNFKKLKSLCVWQVIWHYRELKIEYWTSWHLLIEKNNNFSYVEVRILVERWNIYEGHIFQRQLLQTCILETTFLCLNTRLRVNKKFPTSHYFYGN